MDKGCLRALNIFDTQYFSLPDCFTSFFYLILVFSCLILKSSLCFGIVAYDCHLTTFVTGFVYGSLYIMSTLRPSLVQTFEAWRLPTVYPAETSLAHRFDSLCVTGYCETRKGYSIRPNDATTGCATGHLVWC